MLAPVIREHAFAMNSGVVAASRQFVCGLLCIGAAIDIVAAELLVLGIAQDAGLPQAGCTRDCCASALADPSRHVGPSCLALVADGRRWMLDCTPQFGSQLALLDRLAPLPQRRTNQDPALDGILLTHAHIGHYAGLLQLGREVMGAQAVPVYAMPRMRELLRTQAPWSQLVQLSNIALHALAADSTLSVSPTLRITPLLVPHRDEFSETVGFRIEGPTHRVLYVPDIDKWQRWRVGLAAALASVDRAYIDGSFFDAQELPGRSLEEIPHPCMVETLELLAELPASERAKIHFIHLNHSNPVFSPKSRQRATVEAAGCHVAVVGERFEL
jgi:pyrroloquinoline quinone biosynthesis protein B